MEDLIDFRCSDDWRDFYAAQGMTYSSGRAVQRRVPDQYYFESPVFQRALRLTVEEAIAQGRPAPAPPPVRAKKTRGLPRR